MEARAPDEWGVVRQDPGLIVLQPTPLCNLRCDYCYLPDLGNRSRMDPALSERLAQDIGEMVAPIPLPDIDDDTPVHRNAIPPGIVRLLWHCGEPLTVGTNHFGSLLEPFEDLRHAKRLRHEIQTNATMITDEWCELFAHRNVKVGVSIDGPRWANERRRTLSGAMTFERSMRGIERLRQHGLDFDTIAVVSLANIPRILERPTEYFEFFRDVIGTRSVGFNIEEQEGQNMVEDTEHTQGLAKEFWQTIFETWKESGCRPIVRELNSVLRYVELVLKRIDNSPTRSSAPTQSSIARDLTPTIGWDGAVVMLSPEFLGHHDETYGNFVAGNLYDTSLAEIMRQAYDMQQAPEYIRDFMEGVRKCGESCGYFDYCGGGQASNKLFEQDSLAVTETAYCRNTIQAPFDALRQSLTE